MAPAWSGRYGVWRERTYVESCRPGDRRTHRVMLTLTKRGDMLRFENEGTAPQDGAMNATYSGWRGSIMVALNELLCWDQYFAIGGALRHVEFDPTPGTFTCALHPASVSTAPVQAMEISLYPAYNVISKMMHPDPEMRRDIQENAPAEGTGARGKAGAGVTFALYLCAHRWPRE